MRIFHSKNQMAGALKDRKPITGPVKIISILTGGQVCEKPFKLLEYIEKYVKD